MQRIVRKQRCVRRLAITNLNVNRFRHLSDEGTDLCHARLEPIVTTFARNNQEFASALQELKHGLVRGEAKACLRRGTGRGVKHDKGKPGRKVRFKS